MISVATGEVYLVITASVVSAQAPFVVSVTVDPDEYMVGVTCQKHKQVVSGKIQMLQSDGKIPSGKVGFSPLKAVGTDCIHGDQDDFIQLDMKNTKN